MTNQLPFAVSPRSISVLLDNRWRSVDVSHPNYKALYEALRQSEKDLDLIRSLIDIPSFIAKATFGRVQVGGDAVRFDGKDIGGVYVERLLSLLKEGFDIEPLARYLEKREQNPVFTAREELDLFFANAETAIAPDGDVFVFKKVQDDYTSYHTGRDGKVFTHTIGSVVEIDEDQVDLNRFNLCSSGLHFCSYHYLSQYHGGRGRVVILKLNPADVRAIPADYNNAKGRAVRYLVVGEVPEEEAKQFFYGKPIYFGFDTGEDEWSISEDSDSDNLDGDTFGDFDNAFINDDEYDSENDYDSEADNEPVTVPASFDIYWATQALDERLCREDRASALTSAFIWEDTKQGFDFWISYKELLLDTGFLADEAKDALLELLAVAQGIVVPQATASVLDETQPVDEKVFKTRDGRLFTASEISQLVKEHGQRGFARVTGIPRTTVQEWLKQI